jgi:hypothetical protein
VYVRYACHQQWRGKAAEEDREERKEGEIAEGVRPEERERPAEIN